MSPKSTSVFMRYGMRPESDGGLMVWGYLTNQTSSFPRMAFIRHDSIVRGRIFNQVEVCVLPFLLGIM